MRRIRVPAVAILAAILAAIRAVAGCSSGGADAPDGGGTPGVLDGPPDPACVPADPEPRPFKLDVLWMVDASTSMCPERHQLAAEFPGFLSAIEEAGPVDLRLAITTQDVCPKDKPHVRGKFVYSPLMDNDISPKCVEKRVLPCVKRTDGTDDCADRPELAGLDPQNWVCEDKPAKFLYSCDKPAVHGDDPYEGDVLFVVNSQCRYKCDKAAAPAACARVFGVPADGCPDGCEPPGDCLARCRDYLFDEERCGRVCSASECHPTCTYPGDPAKGYAGANFPRQDFLCTLVCDPAPRCGDVCIADQGKPSYRCLYKGGDYSHAGCLLPPPTASCPPAEEGPKVLDAEAVATWVGKWKEGSWAGDPRWSGLDDDALRRRVAERLFSCMEMVGAHWSPCGGHYQGLRAAWMALDPAGENAGQAREFHRPDATLLVVLVSDGEDCSSTDGAVKAEQYGTCGCLADHDGCLSDGTCGKAPGPLVPTGEAANRLKTLKPDPARVLYAATMGDAVAGTPTSPVPAGEEDRVRRRFRDCKCLPQPTAYSPLTYVCASERGKADLGARYMEVARAFGPNGRTGNICGDGPLTAGAVDLARAAAAASGPSACVPGTLWPDRGLRVYRVGTDGLWHAMAAGGTDGTAGDYDLIEDPGCPAALTTGLHLENAIRLSRALQAGERVGICPATPSVATRATGTLSIRLHRLGEEAGPEVCTAVATAPRPLTGYHEEVARREEQACDELDLPGVPARPDVTVTVLGRTTDSPTPKWIARRRDLAVPRGTTPLDLTLWRVGTSTPIPPPAELTGRAFPSAVRLGDGRVLVTGGFTAATPGDPANVWDHPSDAAFLYDPVTRAFVPVESRMAEGRAAHAAVFVPGPGGGRVLLFGGSRSVRFLKDGAFPLAWDGADSIASYEVFDVATATFAAPARTDGEPDAMRLGRAFASAIPLADGSVLVAGGGTLPVDPDAGYRRCDLWAPWANEGAGGLLPEGPYLSFQRVAPAWAAVAPASLGLSQVVLVGGDRAGTYDVFRQSSRQAQGVLGAFAEGSLGATRYFATATDVGASRVLIAGGSGLAAGSGLGGWKLDPPAGKALRMAYLALEAEMAPVDAPCAARVLHTATAGGEGHSVTLVGGLTDFAGGVATACALDFDPAPAAQVEIPIAAPDLVRVGHAAVLLPDDTVLVVGGTADPRAGVLGGPGAVSVLAPPTIDFDLVPQP
ncbi:MAG: hypothetical protein FJ087_00785 [Deltaproteobacteria bacterium]|nr:hypothetical protein [Deltaproteobacteria bacterium]